jgi:hypothetical protein
MNDKYDLLFNARHTESPRQELLLAGRFERPKRESLLPKENARTILHRHFCVVLLGQTKRNQQKERLDHEQENRKEVSEHR